MANSPQIPELKGIAQAGTPTDSVFFVQKNGNSRRSSYKGGRRLPSGEMFDNWLKFEGKDLRDIEKILQRYARESTSKRDDGIIINFPTDFLHEYLKELKYGRYKSPGWFIALLIQSGVVTVPWWTQFDGETEAHK